MERGNSVFYASLLPCRATYAILSVGEVIVEPYFYKTPISLWLVSRSLPREGVLVEFRARRKTHARNGQEVKTRQVGSLRLARKIDLKNFKPGGRRV